MATFRTYRCNQCGYSVQTEPSGKYALMSGPYTNYACGYCHEVVSVLDWDIDNPNQVKCPECNHDDKMSVWNPIKCKCPKCSGKMNLDKSGLIIMAD